MSCLSLRFSFKGDGARLGVVGLDESHVQQQGTEESLIVQLRCLEDRERFTADELFRSGHGSNNTFVI